MIVIVFTLFWPNIYSLGEHKRPYLTSSKTFEW